MKPVRPSDVAALLKRKDFHPSRVLGQNFLIDGNTLDILVREADLRPTDRVLEVGPGLGVLTAPLLEHTAGVTAVEKDRALFQHLDQTLGEDPRLTLHHSDILDLPLDELLATGITRVVANLPYGIASRFLVDLAFATAPPPLIVATVQWEVAERLTASPGTKIYSALSLLVGHAYAATVRKKVPPTCFLPRPKIHSAIIRMERHTRPGPVDLGLYRNLVRGLFSQRRKQLGTTLPRLSLAQGMSREEVLGLLADQGIDPTQRPETLSIDAFIALADALRN